MPLVLASPALAAPAMPRTSTTWTTVGKDGVDIIPYVRSDKKALWVDFESANFKNIDYVYYNLNYDTDEQDTKRGIEGSFNPNLSEISAYYKNKPYFRKLLMLGVCSANACVYHNNPRSVTLTVNTKMKSGKISQYTRVLSIPDSQFK